MLTKPFDDLAFADIQQLAEHGIAEGPRLEFKRDHYGRTDDARREFAADVSAMANAQGGDLIIGVSEGNGRASAITGIEVDNPDRLMLEITASLRDSIEPQIPGLRVKWIPQGDRRGVVLVRVPRSWQAPHRVTRGGRFYLRDENGKHPMTLDELRHAFLYGQEIERRLRDFRTERLALLEANEGPLALPPQEPSLVIHLIPLGALTGNVQIVPSSRSTSIGPIGARGWNDLHSIDGLVTYSGPEEVPGTVRAFTTLFRTGVVEAIATIYTAQEKDKKALSAGLIQEMRRISLCWHYYLHMTRVLTGYFWTCRNELCCSE